MLAANKNAKVQDEANEPALRVLSVTALGPAAPSPSGAGLSPGREARESRGCPRTERRLPDICSPEEQVWVHVLMLSSTSYTWGEPQLVIWEQGLITGLNEVMCHKAWRRRRASHRLATITFMAMVSVTELHPSL